MIKYIPVPCVVCTFGVLISVLIEWMVRQCGFILTPDSLNYLSAALSFETAGVFLSPDGTPYTNWPPLFPVFLSFFESPEDIMVFVNIFCKAGIAYCVYVLGNRFLQNTSDKLLFYLSFFLSVYLLLISVFLWSELIFLLLLLTHILVALDWEKKRWGYLTLLLTGFLLCLQRNAGLYWVIGTLIWVIIYKQERTVMFYLRTELFYMVRLVLLG